MRARKWLRFRRSADVVVCTSLWHFASDKQTWLPLFKIRSASRKSLWTDLVFKSFSMTWFSLLCWASFLVPFLSPASPWINIRLINFKQNYATCTKPSHNSLKEKKNVMMKSRCCRSHTLTDIQLMEIQHRARFKVSVRLSFSRDCWEKKSAIISPKTRAALQSFLTWITILKCLSCKNWVYETIWQLNMIASLKYFRWINNTCSTLVNIYDSIIIL